jgi:hypothetical protein
MAPRNQKAGLRRLAEMSAEPTQTAWQPEEPPGPPWDHEMFLNENVKLIQSLRYDDRDRLVEWAVIQQAKRDGVWRKVAVYDNCHGKGVHRHLCDRAERRFDENLICAVNSYDDVSRGLDDVIDWLATNWLENERRSDRGY